MKSCQSNLVSLLKRISAEDMAGGKLFRCSECEFQTDRPRCLKIHERVHTGEKPFSCSKCNKKFSVSSSLKNHERIHTGEKPFSCSQCNHKYTSASSLRRHYAVHGVKIYPIVPNVTTNTEQSAT